ncbi:hypothetical protein [Lichenicoccus sp.]|uniref:hypothetical protein n=1 Tax=Lichenicoccus sp. TaxID=2781899 RepID=UPI003D09EBA3
MISPSSLSAFSASRPAASPGAAAGAATTRTVQLAGAQPMAPAGQRPAQPDPTARRGSLLDRMA